MFKKGRTQALATIAITATFTIIFQKTKQNITKTPIYKRLLTKIHQQLLISVPTTTPQTQLTPQHLQSQTPTQLLNTHRQNLKKSTAQKLALFSKIQNEYYLKQHLIIYGMIAGGLFVLPGTFYRILFGYCSVYMYSIIGRGAQLKYGYQLPFSQSYDFDAFQYLFGLACFGVLIGGVGHRGFKSFKSVNRSKHITIRKQ